MKNKLKLATVSLLVLTFMLAGCTADPSSADKVSSPSDNVYKAIDGDISKLFESKNSTVSFSPDTKMPIYDFLNEFEAEGYRLHSYVKYVRDSSKRASNFIVNYELIENEDIPRGDDI